VIRLHDDFIGGAAYKPGDKRGCGPGDLIDWPLERWTAKGVVNAANAGRWSWVEDEPKRKRAKKEEPEPAPPPAGDGDDAASDTLAWLTAHPPGDWKDLVKVARALGFDGRRKAEAVGFLNSLERDGERLSAEAFHAILADLG